MVAPKSQMRLHNYCVHILLRLLQAESYGLESEQVPMVEKFKKLMKE